MTTDETLKILLLEDNPGDAELLETALRRVQMQFNITRIGLLKALDGELRKQDFDLLILDMNLPDSQGLDTVRAALALAWRVPVLVMSGVENEQTALAVIAMGAQDYVIKGEIDRWTLVRTIRHAIERKQAQDALQRARDELELKAKERVILEATEREQQRIGRDLHDSIQGSLAGIKMMLAVLMRSKSPHEAAEQVEQITQVVDNTLRQTRNLARSLCPVNMQADGLLAALERLASTVDDVYGVPCEFSFKGKELNLEENLASHLYYISSEALNNAIKHAKAKKIVIRLESRQRELWLTVEDNGIGMPKEYPTGGMGLSTMRHRAAAIGAELTLCRSSSGGTAVKCHLPARA